MPRKTRRSPFSFYNPQDALSGDALLRTRKKALREMRRLKAKLINSIEQGRSDDTATLSSSLNSLCIEMHPLYHAELSANVPMQ